MLYLQIACSLKKARFSDWHTSWIWSLNNLRINDEKDRYSLGLKMHQPGL